MQDEDTGAMASKAEEVEAKTFPMSRHLTPLYKFDDEGLPVHNGTGILIQTEGTKQLITATHVMDKNPDISKDLAGELFCLCDTTLRQVSEGKWTTIADKRQPQPDNIDISFIGMEEDVASKLSHGEFYEYIDPNPYLQGERVFIGAMGYPYTRNRPDIRNRGLYRSTSTYFGMLLGKTEVQKLGFNPELNFGFHFDIDTCFKDGVFDIKGIRPAGISGGAVWVVHNSALSAEDLAKPVLMGVITEYLTLQKAFIGTYIHVTGFK